MSITPMLLLAIACGGALGALARFFTQHIAGNWFGLTFPWGTLAANILGCFIMGLLAGYWGSHDFNLSQELRGFLVIGFLGAFTTFSAFSLDSLVLFQNGEHFKALFNVIGSLVLCLIAVYLGNLLTSR